MRKLCIYHAECNDGFGAAWAVWKRYGDEFEYFPAVHNEPPPAEIEGRDIVMVDFAYPRAVFADVVTKAKSVLVLDHHISMVTELEPWLNKSAKKPASIEAWSWDGVCVILDMSHSGAMLAWQFFHPEDTAPILTMLIEDYDLYRLKYPGSKDMAFALASYPQDFNTWSDLYAPSLIKEGRHIRRFMRKEIDHAKTNATTMNIGGMEVPAVNTSHAYANDVAGELSENHPFAACYWVTPTGTQFSLRSKSDGADVSEIARRYGGGGHKHAAGFLLRPGSSL